MSRRTYAALVAGVGVLAASGLLSPRSTAAQLEDLRCNARAALSRFTIISTKDSDRRDLYLGAGVTVGTTDVPGTCGVASGTCECPRLRCFSAGERCGADSDCSDGACSGGACVCSPSSCEIAGRRCAGDEDCLVGAPGRCDTQTDSCRCPASSPRCQMDGRNCVSDRDCTVPPWLIGRSTGGVCGNDMLITAGSRMGLLVTRGDVDFGSLSKCRTLRIEREFANTRNGQVLMSQDAPFLGPVAGTSDDSRACALNRRCGDRCITGRRLVVGPGVHSSSSSDGETRRGLMGNGTSLNFKLCDAAVTLLESTGNDRKFGPSPFQSAIENFQPLASQRIALGERNCLACRAATSLDRDCAPCAADDRIRIEAPVEKIVITLGGGLQVLDLQRVTLAEGCVLELRGQRDTVALIRVRATIRLGPEAKVLLASNGSGNGTLQVDKVLWVAAGNEGGQPSLARASTFRGTLLASGRAGIRLSSAVLVEGALWSRKVSVGIQSTIQHYPFSELFPLPGSPGEGFTTAQSERHRCS